MLPVLWRDYAAQLTEMLLQLMVKFGLLVPLRTQNTATATADAVTQYLVPTLLSPASLLDPSVAQWTDQHSSSCYLVFTLAKDLKLRDRSAQCWVLAWRYIRAHCGAGPRIPSYYMLSSSADNTRDTVSNIYSSSSSNKYIFFFFSFSFLMAFTAIHKNLY